MKAGTSTPGEDRESGPITRSGICQRVDDLPQAGHSRRDQVHTDNDGGPVLAIKGQNRPTPEGGRGAAPRPGGWARIPIWGRGNDSRLRGLPGYPPAKPDPTVYRHYNQTRHGGTAKDLQHPEMGSKFEGGGVRGRGWHRSYSRSQGQKKAERARAFSACFRRTIEI